VVALGFVALSAISLPGRVILVVLGWGVALIWVVRIKAQIILMLLYLEFLALNVILVLLFAFPTSRVRYPLLFTFFVLAVSEARFGLAILVGFYRAHNRALLN